MGTNYYVKSKRCKECGHKPPEIHLGKSSWGWQFSFQYNNGEYYKNVEEMRYWLKYRKIKDEYGADVTPAQFWKMVEEKQVPENSNHAEQYPSEDNFVIDGYSFSNCEFS